MFAKVFSQIFDSSICEDYLSRLVFIDLLILADRHGQVDMTAAAIARRTNVPPRIVKSALAKLSSPDNASRTPTDEGRRIVPLDSHRDWGWQIVNYEHYRNLRDEDQRTAYFREYRRAARAKPKESTGSSQVHSEVHVDVQLCSAPFTQAEAEAEAEAEVTPPTPPPQEEKIDASMAVSGVIDMTGLHSSKARVVLDRMARKAEISGEDMAAWADKMVAAWRHLEESRPKLEYAWGAETFFGEGHFKNPDGWPWKKDHRRPSKLRAVNE